MGSKRRNSIGRLRTKIATSGTVAARREAIIQISSEVFQADEEDPKLAQEVAEALLDLAEDSDLEIRSTAVQMLASQIAFNDQLKKVISLRNNSRLKSILADDIEHHRGFANQAESVLKSLP